MKMTWKSGLKIQWVVVVMGICSSVPPAGAEWVTVSKALPEADIHYVAADPKDPKTLYAASSRRLYRSTDQGVAWKRVLSLRSTSDTLNALYFDPQDTSRVYAATRKGIRLSKDRGDKWEVLYQGVGDASKTVHALAGHPKKPQKILAATEGGLLEIDRSSGEFVPVANIPKNGTYSIWTDPSGVILVTTSKGIWKSADGAETWERVFVQTEHEGSDGGSLEQFQIEELSLNPSFSNIVHMPGDRLFAASTQGLLAGDVAKKEWSLDKNGSFTQRIQYLAASSNALYAATDKGVFTKEPDKGSFHNISDGLGSVQVRMLHFDPMNNSLYAATQAGVYRYIYPDTATQSVPLSINERPASIPVNAREVLGRFDHEPSVLEIQQAAIRYAEVHPEKIEAWRSAAMKKALLPTLSLGADLTEDENIDLDRGGTNDPDRFISGPVEKSTDWSVGVNWDLGDIIWNDDQTSIDTRSKLMVELRDDVLTEVTHLYYERRRLQVDLLLAPPQQMALAVEKDLKLQELTANIDALTGGYLSKKLGG